MKKYQRTVYLDNNATTRVDNKVTEYMNHYFLQDYAVASSQFSHTPGIKARDAVEKARSIILGKLRSGPGDQFIFTSGGAESNNMALKGLALTNKDPSRKKIIISGIEHFSVLNTAKALEKSGFEVKEVKVDGQGFIDLEHLQSLLDEKTLLVSIIYANHEVGTIQDMPKISDIVHQKGALLHTDAAIAFLQTPIDVQKQNIDLLSLSAHKIHGPKGSGGLFIKKNIPVQKILDGGYQENNLRPGTENVPGIAGFGKAVEIFKEKDLEKVKGLRDYLYNGLGSRIEHVLINGSKDLSKRVANNLNVSFEYIEGESVVLHLDMRGIAVITGSACFSRALQASHVLLAMGFTHERAHGSIKYSLSKYLTRADMDYTIKQTKEVVEKLRDLSPLKSTTF
ncbi:MAG: cysteine desulfurase [Spirochaetes bacterium]|nr:cysteine desulfurase [Spirochaetota bacterium]